MGGSSMRDIVPRFAFILTYWSSASVLLVRKLVSGESLRSPARLQQQPLHSLWKRTNRYLWYCRKVYQDAIFQVCELCKSRTFLFVVQSILCCLLFPSFVHEEVYYLVNAACGNDQAHYLPKAPHVLAGRDIVPPESEFKVDHTKRDTENSIDRMALARSQSFKNIKSELNVPR